MPELPEVETTLRGIEPHLKNNCIKRISVFQSQLRWPVSDQLTKIRDCKVTALRRRAKYILLDTQGRHAKRQKTSGSSYHYPPWYVWQFENS